jgi:N4-(beta-N-acetylglucosaminyl)-L-asparaginase
MKKLSRRRFLEQSISSGIVATISPSFLRIGQTRWLYEQKKDWHPVVVSSINGERATAKAMEMLRSNGDPLDAAIAGVTLVENDPEDINVGLGGLPNENGIVQLDASVMYGPTHNAGAVGALEGIKNPSRVARLVMERSDHVLLVGNGAQQFAKAHGFKVEDLLTEKARRIWLYWKETLNEKDDWFPPNDELHEEVKKYFDIQGTITCCALNHKRDLAAVTTTSGLAFKIPGRVGDSPIIGAGLYVDNEIGAVGSTGRGEANLKNLSCFMAVELMRQGLSPTEACLKVCERIVQNSKLKYLLNRRNLPNFNVKFYAVNKNGDTGGASIYEGGMMWVFDGKGQRVEKLAFLHKP